MKKLKFKIYWAGSWPIAYPEDVKSRLACKGMQPFRLIDHITKEEKFCYFC